MKSQKKNQKKNFFFQQNRKILIGPNFPVSLVRGRLALQIAFFRFFRTEKRKFRRKLPLETHFGTFWGILKKSIFPALRGQKGTKNVKKIEISKKMTMSALGDFHPQNDDFEFSNAEKRKFRKKIPLETDFQAYWTILKKSIFLAPKPSGGVGFFIYIWSIFPLNPLYICI